MEFGALNYAILGIYLAVVFGIGLKLAGKQRSTDDYFLAGRRMPWPVVGMSIFASMSSAISYMGLCGNAYEENVSWIAVAPVSPVVAPFLIYIFYPFYRRLSVTTSYEYIAVRFSPLARTAVSGLFLLARLGWLGTVIFAPSLALHTATGIRIELAIVLMGILATSYTTLGGLSAVLWTDMIQFIILVGGAVWMAVELIQRVPGNLTGIYDVAQTSGHLDAFAWDISLWKLTVPLVGCSLFWQLMQDYGTDQVTVQRLMAVKRPAGIAKAILLNSLTDLVMVSLLMFVGVGIFAYYHHFPDARITELDVASDEMMPFFIVTVLPPGLSGLLISGIFAAAMSSMDSGINSLSTVIVNDFIKPSRRRRGKPDVDARNVALARVLTVGLGALAIAIAFGIHSAEKLDSILKASNTFLGAFAAPILAFFLLGMFTRRANFPGWLVGAMAGIATTIWLQNAEFGADGKQVHFLWYFPICFATTVVVGYSFGLVFNLQAVNDGIRDIVARRPQAERELTIWGRSELRQVMLSPGREDDPPAQ